MSKAQIIPPAGGGGGMVGFENLWEGDVHLTGTVADFTGGAVDLSGYQVVLVRYHGHLESSSYYGLGDVGNRNAWDGTSGETDVDITRFFTRYTNGSKHWAVLRQSGSYHGVEETSESNAPLKFVISGIADLHFSIYGMKL